MMRHISSTVAPPLWYAVQWVNGSWCLGDGERTSLETAPSPVTRPRLSIKNNNYILPYSLQILTLIITVG
jgi:hypothetical protein